MCHVIFPSGVISHPETAEVETAVLVVSCEAIGFLSVAC